MDEKIMRELNLDEMDTVNGGNGLWTRENGNLYWNKEKCTLCEKKRKERLKQHAN